ncbi:hypothetical protein CKY39_07950 [Variovorax boronicumulans]|uniref:Uncharacterized protein n=1 Tax=Variovorax boronicumulans TaxID=436515 RepID=A0A250DFP3_9BURK|nr:hypothetical protein [Variovorax boronicumulans]ATA53150.1 hypothetical protein CKY39_07950 [Variovorax boronicumulans]
MSIEVTFSSGLVIRQSALVARGVTRTQLLEALESARPMAEDGELLSFGPCFGQEACDEFVRRLEALGLVYVDDFFDLTLSHPDWLKFSAQYDGSSFG